MGTWTELSLRLSTFNICKNRYIKIAISIGLLLYLLLNDFWDVKGKSTHMDVLRALQNSGWIKTKW